MNNYAVQLGPFFYLGIVKEQKNIEKLIIFQIIGVQQLMFKLWYLEIWEKTV